jgi:SAM-dependent methyltransferase
MAYLMAGQSTELERLQLQSRVWELAGGRLLNDFAHGSGRRALDVGCGCFGWLRLLSSWVSPDGVCVGTDNDDAMLVAARDLCRNESLLNVEVLRDDLFNTALPEGSFDLVHARFQLAPLGRFEEQIDSYVRLLAPKGILVLEDPFMASWAFFPEAPNARRLIEMVGHAFTDAGGDFNVGMKEYDLLKSAGFDPQFRAEVIALPPRHPYLRLPLQFAAALRSRLLKMIDVKELDALINRVTEELANTERRGLTFTLFQTWVTKT